MLILPRKDTKTNLMSIPEALFTGKNKIYYEEISSTNIYAMDLVSKTNPPDGTCIITDYQTAGRGQIGRYWHSDVGKNLLVSYIFYPHTLKVNDQFYLNIISGLAVRDVVSHWVENIKIKWPNDIYIGNKKAAGILVQNVLRGDFIRSTVVGIGLNVNERDFPADLPNPISVSSITGFDIEIDQVFHFVSARLEFYYLQLRNNKHTFLQNEYLSQLYRKDEWAEYTDSSGFRFSGCITGIDPQGKLQMMIDNGAVKSFGFREVGYVI